METKVLNFCVNLTKDSIDYNKTAYTNIFKTKDSSGILRTIEDPTRYLEILNDGTIRLNFTEPIYYVNNIQVNDIQISKPNYFYIPESISDNTLTITESQSFDLRNKSISDILNSSYQIVYSQDNITFIRDSTFEFETDCEILRTNKTTLIPFLNNNQYYLTIPVDFTKYLKGIKIKSQLLEDTGFEPIPIKKDLIKYFFDSSKELVTKTYSFSQPIQKLLYFDFYITDMNDNVLQKESIEKHDIFYIEFSLTYSTKMSENKLKL